jgi:hypothetical protein
MNDEVFDPPLIAQQLASCRATRFRRALAPKAAASSQNQLLQALQLL